MSELTRKVLVFQFIKEIHFIVNYISIDYKSKDKVRVSKHLMSSNNCRRN